jgi:hypothetical protein
MRYWWCSPSMVPLCHSPSPSLSVSRSLVQCLSVSLSATSFQDYYALRLLINLPVTIYLYLYLFIYFTLSLPYSSLSSSLLFLPCIYFSSFSSSLSLSPPPLSLPPYRFPSLLIRISATGKKAGTTGTPLTLCYG